MPDDIGNIIDGIPSHIPVSDLYFNWRVTSGTGVYVPVAKILVATYEFKFAARTAYVNWEAGHV